MLAVVRPGSSGSALHNYLVSQPIIGCLLPPDQRRGERRAAAAARHRQLAHCHPATATAAAATGRCRQRAASCGSGAVRGARVRVCGPSHIPVSTGQHTAPQPAQDVSTADCVMILVVLPRTCSRSNSLTHTGDILEYFEQTFLTRLSSVY